MGEFKVQGSRVQGHEIENQKSKTCTEPFGFAQDKLSRSIANPKSLGDDEDQAA
jgi:hypothetical protein